jgi:hypothetical protein
MKAEELNRLNDVLKLVQEARQKANELLISYSQIEHDLRNAIQIKMFEKLQEDRKAQTIDKSPLQKPDQ